MEFTISVRTKLAGASLPRVTMNSSKLKPKYSRSVELFAAEIIIVWASPTKSIISMNPLSFNSTVRPESRPANAS